MRHILTLSLAALLVVSCRKEMNKTQYTYLEKVSLQVKDSLRGTDYSDLDFSKAILSKVDSEGLYFLRIPFKGKSIKSDFVLLQTRRSGEIKRGKIIMLEGGIRTDGEGKEKAESFDGEVFL